MSLASPMLLSSELAPMSREIQATLKKEVSGLDLQ